MWLLAVMAFGLVSLVLHCFLQLSSAGSVFWFLGVAGLLMPSPCDTQVVTPA